MLSATTAAQRRSRYGAVAAVDLPSLSPALRPVVQRLRLSKQKYSQECRYQFHHIELSLPTWMTAIICTKREDIPEISWTHPLLDIFAALSYTDGV
jgi:hypothetical protein